jgi:hypothetical protein
MEWEDWAGGHVGAMVELMSLMTARRCAPGHLDEDCALRAALYGDLDAARIAETRLKGPNTPGSVDPDELPECSRVMGLSFRNRRGHRAVGFVRLRRMDAQRKSRAWSFGINSVLFASRSLAPTPPGRIGR